MIKILSNFDLTNFNTFKVPSLAKKYLTISSVKDIEEIVFQIKESPNFFILGEGANVLFVSPILDLVIKNEIKGITKIFENEDSTTFEVGAGENWHDFVMFIVENGLSGIENLAYIPGTVGAAPVQNLAAYGQNVGSVIESVTGIPLDSPISPITLKNDQLNLFYRDSIFKHGLKNKFIITSVTFKLSKTPKFDTNYHGSKPYESLQTELSKINPDFPNTPYTPKMVALAVTNQRKIKLPDWHQIGTAGSFFKNPFVSKTKFDELAKVVKDLQPYPVNAMLYPNPDDPVFKMVDMVKVPAGRLLEELGWRGKRIGNVGTHEKHALVLVNHGGATGQEVFDYAKLMQEDVKKNYDVDLETEVNII